jgi:hypothetical protein
VNYPPHPLPCDLPKELTKFDRGGRLCHLENLFMSINNRAIIPAMKTNELGRTQAIYNLRIFVVALAVFSLDLGMNITSIARAIGHGDSFQILRLDEVMACIMAAGILFMGFGIHRSIQALSRPDNDQRVTPTPI